MQIVGPTFLFRRGLRFVAGIFALLATGASMAAPENITDGELALLPAFCQDVQAIRYAGPHVDLQGRHKSPRADYWLSLMGPNFWDLHHYCWGLIEVRRSTMAGLDGNTRTGLIKSAIADYLYVVGQAKEGFLLLPEIFLRVGEAELMLGNVIAGSDAFAKSRALKPDYWPAYTRWIDFLLKAKRPGEAKALAAEGLRFSPQAKELIDRYRKLGGDPSTIVPVVTAPPPSNEEGSDSAAQAALPASAASATTVAPAASR